MKILRFFRFIFDILFLMLVILVFNIPSICRFAVRVLFLMLAFFIVTHFLGIWLFLPLLLFALYALPLYFRKELVFSKVQTDEGFFLTFGERKRFWIVKDKRYVFSVKKGLIVSFRDLRHPLKAYKYGGELYGDNRVA